MDHLRRNAVAYVALFVALGGTSYAASLERNSVGRAQLKDNAVGTKEVRNRSLLRRDFKAGQLPVGKTGPAGAQGAAGPKGEGTKGDQGEVGPTFGQQPVAQGETGPSDTTEVGLGDGVLSLPAAGRVLVWGRAQIQIGCTAGNAHIGLYLAGVPVQGTGQIVSTTGLTRIDLMGLSEPVAAGDRQLELRADCPSGDWNMASGSNVALGGVLVGG